MEGETSRQVGAPPPLETRPPDREGGVVDRRLSAVAIFILDTGVKAAAIIFWYIVITPFFRIWGH